MACFSSIIEAKLFPGELAPVPLRCPLPFVGCLLDLQVRAGHRIDRELVGRDVALGLPSFVVRAETLT